MTYSFLHHGLGISTIHQQYILANYSILRAIVEETTTWCVRFSQNKYLNSPAPQTPEDGTANAAKTVELLAFVVDVGMTPSEHVAYCHSTCDYKRYMTHCAIHNSLRSTVTCHKLRKTHVSINRTITRSTKNNW